MKGHPSYRVLVRLAHTVLDGFGSGAAHPFDVTEELKCRAARASIAYDGAVVRKALESAEVQRTKRTTAFRGRALHGATREGK